MPDQRSAMKEYRLLERKRLSEGLSPDEQARFARLKDLVGTDAAPAGSGFDVNAAAARLRESLLPAGLRNRPPPEPPPEPDPEPELGLGTDPAQGVDAGALAAAWEEAPLAPVEPGPADAEPFFDPATLGGEGADAGAGGHAAHEAAADQAWDPSAQPYDPSAAAAYDPNAQQGWDPSAQPYDPSAQAVDPNSLAGYDPSAELAFDPNAQPYHPDAATGYDPSAYRGWDPNVPQEDGAAGEDPGAQGYAALAHGAAPELDLSVEPIDLGAPAADPGWDPSAGWEAGASGGEPGLGPDALAGALDLGHDPSAEPSPELGAEIPPLSLGAYDDPDAAPLAAGSPDDVELPFDAAAEAAVHAGDLAEPPPEVAPALGAYDDLSAFDRAPGDLPADGPGFRAAASVGDPAAAWQTDQALEAGFQLESAGSFEGPSTGGLPAEDDAYAAAPAGEPGPAPEASSPAPAEPVALEPEAVAQAVASAAAAGAPAELPTIDGTEILEELPPDEAPPARALAFEPLATAPKAEAPEPPTPAPPSPPPEPAAQVEGVHRVVVHTLEGQVKRGVLDSPDLAAAVLGLAAQPGAEPEVIGTDKVKAIFFMLAPGEKAPTPQGQRVRVTFRDGRQVAGFSPDYREGAIGFFMVPADTRTNTGRIWVYRAAVRQVAIS